jgi:Ca2+-binding EF-hand superfamily protein
MAALRTKPSVPSLKLAGGDQFSASSSKLEIPSRSSSMPRQRAGGLHGSPNTRHHRAPTDSSVPSVVGGRRGVGPTSQPPLGRGFFRGSPKVGGAPVAEQGGSMRSSSTMASRGRGPRRLQYKRKDDDTGISRAPAYRPTRGKLADTINARGGGAASGGTNAGASQASRAAANLANLGSEEDGPTTVVVKSAAAAEDLVRAEQELSGKLRDALKGKGGGKHPPSHGSKRASDQVARSLAKRRQARLEMAQLRSQSAFVDWLWLGNTVRPDRMVDTSADGADSADGGDSSMLGEGAVSIDPDALSPFPLSEPGEEVALAAAAPAAPDDDTAVPQLWTAAGETDGQVKTVSAPRPRNRRGSLGASAVDKILSDFDKHKAEVAETGGKKRRRGRDKRPPPPPRPSTSSSAAAAASSTTPGVDASGDAKAALPQNEQAPERGNIRAKLAAKRRHVPDGGCARCWAISTRCCAEAWELRQARAEAARQAIVLTGRAQEAVEVLGLTQSQVRTLNRRFMALDDGLEGRIHLNDFFEEFLELPRSAVTDAIWLALVENTTGQMLGFEDFVLIVCVYCMFTEEDILRFCFSTFDVNGESCWCLVTMEQPLLTMTIGCRKRRFGRGRVPHHVANR